jgi:predicted RNA-binding protein YlxR (DUF448 family)
VPQRRCAGCGILAPKFELMRIALAGDAPSRRAVCDTQGTMPGRGAYLCREACSERAAVECLQRALRRGGIARALRCAVALDPKLVESMSQ